MSTQNDIGFNKTFPYEGTPQNGRNHAHPDPNPSYSKSEPNTLAAPHAVGPGRIVNSNSEQ